MFCSQQYFLAKKQKQKKNPEEIYCVFPAQYRVGGVSWEPISSNAAIPT